MLGVRTSFVERTHGWLGVASVLLETKPRSRGHPVIFQMTSKIHASEGTIKSRKR